VARQPVDWDLNTPHAFRAIHEICRKPIKYFNVPFPNTARKKLAIDSCQNEEKCTDLYAKLHKFSGTKSLRTTAY